MSSGAIYEPCCSDTNDEGLPIDISEVEECIAAHEPVFVEVRKGINCESYFLPVPDILESASLSFPMQFRRVFRLMEVKGRLHENKAEFKEAAETYMDHLRFAADYYNNSAFGDSISGIGCEYGVYKGLETLLGRLEDPEECEALLEELIEIEEHRPPLRHQVELGRTYIVGSLRDSIGISLYWGEPLIDPGPGDYFLDTMRRTCSYLLARLTGWWWIGNTDRFYRDLAEISGGPYPNIIGEPLEDRVQANMAAGIMLPALEKAFPTIAWQ